MRLPAWPFLATVVLISSQILFLAGLAHAGLPPLDPDALAKRFPNRQELYQKTRDEALAVYAKQNTGKPPYDDDCKTVIRLFAYLAVWDDFYKEGLWNRGLAPVSAARSHGATYDVLLDAYRYSEGWRDGSMPRDEDVAQFNNYANIFARTPYPPLMKMQVLMAALRDLDGYIENHHPDPSMPSMQTRTLMVQSWGESYRVLIKEGVPNEFLFEAGDRLLHAVGDDEDLQHLVAAEIDHDFNEAAPGNVVRQELEGDALITDAWCARGSDWASTVTNAGWKLFGERLAKADALLGPLFEMNPKDINICHLMMNVELGQGKGRDRMEEWFQRGVMIDRHSFTIFTDKAWYLQPRWYGSMEDLCDFGRECAGTKDWAAKIPMVYVHSISKDSQEDASHYKDPQIWADLEKVYRDYLDHYPNAIFYRTSFAKHAFDSGRVDVAKEQFGILGADWDRDVLTDQQYSDMMNQLGR